MSRVSAICQRTVYPGPDTIDTRRTNHVTTPRDSPSQLHVAGISDMSADRVPGPDTIDTHRSNHVTTCPSGSPSQLHVTGISDMSADRVPRT
ncbi:hypothetical protein RRG08_057543 [Elysia crispata]|uniref:Uncharacterized protein n=1 Tax=Elysia crispata TaxID=231223 RepID=A0AAE1DVB2_9GAST|nr:hypothetical protein RRG08_057543 [Elysia crispata]